MFQDTDYSSVRTEVCGNKELYLNYITPRGRQVKIVMLLFTEKERWKKRSIVVYIVLLNILNVNINKYEQRQCNRFFRDNPLQCGS